MSKPFLYESPEDARLATSSALSVDQMRTSSAHADTAALPIQTPDAQERAQENIRATFERIKREWGES